MLACGRSCPCQACQQRVSMGVDGLGFWVSDAAQTAFEAGGKGIASATPWGAISNVIGSAFGVGQQYLVGEQQAKLIKAQAAGQRLSAREAEKDRELQQQLVFAQATAQERQQMYDVSSQKRTQEVIALSGIGLVAVGISILFIWQGMKKR